jgi:hypothetical protein
MRASTVIPVTASISIADTRLHSLGIEFFTEALKFGLDKVVLSKTDPQGMFEYLTVRRPDDTYVWVRLDLNGDVQADLVIS